MERATEGRKRMLLHVCCAPCSPYVVDTLGKEYDLVLYFYNPNIHFEEEYVKRLDEVRAWAAAIGLPMIEDEYDAERWFEKTRGLESEPEKGRRCEVCFDMRLSRAAEKAAELGVGVFGTVLTVSPHKDAVAINSIGSACGSDANVTFMEADWKKKEGFKITTRMARGLDFYRQDYCGCVFSRRQRDTRRQAG